MYVCMYVCMFVFEYYLLTYLLTYYMNRIGTVYKLCSFVANEQSESVVVEIIGGIIHIQCMLFVA